MKNSILIQRNKRLIFWTRRIFELTASCLVGPVIFSNLFLQFPPGQQKEENFLLLGSFGFSSFFIFFLLCLFSFAMLKSGNVCGVPGTALWRLSHRDARSNLF